MKATKAGTGQYLQLGFQILDGPHKGRKLWARLNLDNPVRPIVCVDLNGVLDAYTGWKNADHWDPPRPGAR